MRILILSPHYDDAPLSLGQAMLDGQLRSHELTVGVVFGRSSWVRWFHPTRRRAPIATAIRRLEEVRNAHRFGYRIVVGAREEATLRLDTTDTTRYLDPAADPSSSEETEAVWRLCAAWAEGYDAILAPLGIGDHIDHLVVAEAGRRLAGSGELVGFYADRPYATALSDAEIDARGADLDPTLIASSASGPITRAKRDALWYPSQFSDLFLSAFDADEQAARCERWLLPDQMRVRVASPRAIVEL